MKTNKETKMPKISYLDQRYSLLWEAFGTREFTMPEAVTVLGKKKNDTASQVPVFISEMRQKGWLEVQFNKEDARKKIYTLKDRFNLSEDIHASGGKLSRADIEAILGKAADLIRTRVDYKFILILLFMKRVSDKWELDFEKAYKDAIKDGLSEEEAKKEARSPAYHDFDLAEEHRWENMRKNVSNLSSVFSKALKSLADRNPELKDILDSVDFVQFTSNRENTEILRQLVELFSEKKLHNVAPDILGDAYEWILRYFAPDKAKEGEIYTPREVVKLLNEILDPQPKESIYDCSCGSAGMLIGAYKHVEETQGEAQAKKILLYGQEVNQKTIALAKLNMYVHDMRDCSLNYGDTLLYPKFKEGDGIKTFDVVIANPPWNQDGYDEDVIKKAEFWQKRFSLGFTPGQSADWAWIQHMLASANDRRGRVGVVIDNGCLFRGGKEQAIRQKVLENDWLECLVLLPEKLFYNTPAPGALMFFNKNKPKERRGKVLIINASSEYVKHPDVRKLNALSEENIKNIAAAYRGFKEIKGVSRAVPIEEIRSNDYNLNITLYVFPEEVEEIIDIEKEWAELRRLEVESKELDVRIEGYIKELLAK
ncbi:MAG: class I SAM-dependent DNA methyltransferase [Desulfobacteraceae bacterium]|nr:class I SAM-dependent DNA methyltransferase [Desulfobacteraceae bacterium]